MSRAVLASDTVTSAMRVHHVGNIAMAGLVPAAFFTPEGSQLQKPVDLALGVVAPVHSHITMNMVLSDYCPPKLRGVARAGLLGVTGGGPPGEARPVRAPRPEWTRFVHSAPART